MREMTFLAGLVLTGIGIVAGVGLLGKSLSSAEVQNKDTLWGLFIIGMLAGLILLGANLRW